MRVRTCGLAALALGILIGAGGCSSESPTSPLAPSAASADKGGIPNAASTGDDTGASVQGGLLNGGGRQTDGADVTSQRFGGLLNGGG